MPTRANSVLVRYATYDGGVNHPAPVPRLVLASSSPARLKTLHASGLDPLVIAPKVDEASVTAADPRELTRARARLKGESVLADLLSQSPTAQAPLVLLACDSMLEIEGRVHGKPGTAEAAVVRWYRMRGRRGLFHTGHFAAVVTSPTEVHSQVRCATTEVTFADLTEAEIAAYAATGEPQRVAGAFAIDGYGGAFITSIIGDTHNVVGISLPLVRQMLIDLGIGWHQLWRR